MPDTQIIDLGAANSSSLARLANHAQGLINSGAPLPPSPFIEMAADRLTGKDKQDLVFFLQGRRGSGKSYSLLWIAQRLADAIALRRGGTRQDYFSLDHCATLEDTDSIMRILQDAGRNQIVIIDDCSLAISNRSWNSPQNRNFNALLSICRTNRWALLLSAPLKSHVDNQVREMCDFTGTVFKSFHAGGFNILRITSSEISTRGKEYTHKLHFGKKIDYWVAFKPDENIAKEYDRKRDKAALEVNKRIVETGSFRPGKTAADPRSRTEKNLERMIAVHGDKIKALVAADPTISLNSLAAKCGITRDAVQRLCEFLPVHRIDKKRGSQK